MSDEVTYADIWQLLMQAEAAQNEYGTAETARVIRKTYRWLESKGAVPPLRRLNDGNMQPAWDDPQRGLDSFGPDWLPGEPPSE